MSLARPLAVYLAGRFLVFGVLLGLLWAVGLGGLIGAAFAVVLSVPISLLLLRRQRERVAVALQERAERRAEFRARLRGPADPT